MGKFYGTKRDLPRGFKQREGINYNESFASVIEPMSYKMIFAIAAAFDLELEQMDIKMAFFYGFVNDEIYVHQPERFDDGSGRVCNLLRALFGLEHAPRPLLLDMGDFVKNYTFIAVYMDGLLIAGPSKIEIVSLK
ncbi:integrase catalytic core [Fusarium beomiforme]|uniref:Integrase catalytic core n=1 Tax=Fusarium beomiforme TaxID=44412 RepID=A0A9P5AEG5_9HYPO|nr:integrase catalytic core [Fusarium beomiforme]